MTLLIALLWAGLAGWLLLLIWVIHNARQYPMVSADSPIALRERPRVSIIIPARNEAETLAITLPKFLNQEYGDYEVILVDDASTDDTQERAAQFLLSHPNRFRVVRVNELPPGWVGKTHALHQGFQSATGEWVLATDADIEFHPKALAAGLWLAQREKAELVSIYAFLNCVLFWEKMILPGFGLLLSAFFPVKKINDPRSSVALASGGYILMRRSVWASLGGYEAIRSEMIDDLNTARLVKHSGRRINIAATKNLVRTQMYHSFQDLWEGLRKNAFAAHRYSVAKMVITVSAYLAGNLLPLVCVLFYGWRWTVLGEALAGHQHTVLMLSIAEYAIVVGMHVPVMLYLEVAPIYSLLAPVAATIYAAICIDSMSRTLLGQGVSWKLREYRRPAG